MQWQILLSTHIPLNLFEVYSFVASIGEHYWSAKGTQGYRAENQTRDLRCGRQACPAHCPLPILPIPITLLNNSTLYRQVSVYRRNKIMIILEKSISLPGVRRNSVWVRRSSVISASACCKAGPSSIHGSAPHCWAKKQWGYKKTGLGEWWRKNECLIVLCEWLLKIINIKKSGIMPLNLWISPQVYCNLMQTEKRDLQSDFLDWCIFEPLWDGDLTRTAAQPRGASKLPAASDDAARITAVQGRCSTLDKKELERYSIVITNNLPALLVIFQTKYLRPSQPYMRGIESSESILGSINVFKCGLRVFFITVSATVHSTSLGLVGNFSKLNFFSGWDCFSRNKNFLKLQFRSFFFNIT